jgi:hypothetical protein
MIYNITKDIINNMSKIITTSELQKNIGKISEYTQKSFVILTNRGKAKAVLLPYFDDSEESISEYLEDYEMMKKKNTLKKRYKDSQKSGKSSLVV